jgi:lysophospholipase L1-like esterase
MREYGQLQVSPAPFYEWRKEGFQGKYINISPEGLRRTWNPDFSGQKPGKTVFCFGGSVMWSFGARDDFTIPSLLSKRLNQKAPHYQVTNYGEPGYTFTQELVYFVLLLKAGQIPDYVVFFDGVNDIYGAYQNGRPGLTQNVGLNKRKLKMSFTELMVAQLTDAINNHFLTYKLVKNLIFRAKQEGGVIAVAGSRMDEAQLTTLAATIVDDYDKNMALVKALAKQYGFRYYFFWQPMLFNTTALTAEEQGYSWWKDKKWVFLHRKVESLIREKKYDHFYNLSTIFDQKQKTVYLDFGHLSEGGNDQVAEAMYQVITRSAPHE